MSEFYGDTGEVWDGENDDPQLGGMGGETTKDGVRVMLTEVCPPVLRPVCGKPGYFFAPIPWYVRLWDWIVRG